MSRYDGSIRINTDIRTKEAQVQLAALENRMVKTTDKISSMRAKMDALKDAKIPTQEFTDLQKEIAAAEKELEKMVAQDSKLADIGSKIKRLTRSSAEYAAKMKEIEQQKIPTQEYTAAQKEVNKYTAALEKAYDKIEKLKEVGTGKRSNEFIETQSEVDAFSKKIEELKQKSSELYKQGLIRSTAKIDRQVEEYTKRLEVAKLNLEKLQETENKAIGAKIQNIQYEAEALDIKLRQAESDMKSLVDSGKAFTLGTDTEQYKNLSAKYEQVNQELDKQKGIHSEIAQKQADAVQKTIELKGQMQQLVTEGKDFTLGQDTEEFAKLGQQLQYAENEMAVLNSRHEVLVGKVKNGYKKLGDTAKQSLDKVSKAQKKANGLLGSFGKHLKSILLATFIFNTIRKALNSLIQGAKEGFENLYKGNEQFKNSVNSLKASFLTLKNSLAAAFSPLVEIAIPYIQRVIEWITKAINLMGQFFAALTGRKTYTKAVKQTAAAFEEATEAAEDETKAVNKQLSPLDRLNNLSSQKEDDKKKDKTAGGMDPGAMFEEVPIDNGILDFLQKIKDFLKPVIDYAKKLKDVFMQGFWDGLGDWQYRWESIKDSLKSIKDSLIDIFTDPAVLAAADAWAQSFVYMIGSLVGSLASIGLTIAANILGGIEKYLEENKDRIKEYLISMFNIWEEINYMFAELFQSIAYVFEAFASEQGQQLTANIIGIFADAFMGINELVSKLFRDIANIIIQPFVDNKEAFRTALEGYLGVLAEVTGTIKQGIDETFDKLNEVYDEHFKPFFDSVAQGLSDLVGQFLEFWNSQVQPILEQWAADFDALWTGHIQPLVNNLAEFLGKIADLLKVIWENYLQPMIAWIIANVLPKILPVLQAIWNTLKNLAGYIADIISNIITILSGLIDFITGVFSGDWEKAFQGLQDIVGGFIELIRTKIEGWLQFLSDIANTFFETIRFLVDSKLNWIKEKVSFVVNFIKQNIIGKFNEIKTAFSTFKANVSQTWTNMWNGLKEKVRSIISGIKEMVKDAFDWISDKVQAIFDKISGVGSKVKDAGMSLAGSPLLSSKSRSASPYAVMHPAVASLQNAEIPAYATGQVIPRTMKEHLAILGDNSRETEVVSPLSTIEQAVMNAMVKAGITGGDNGDGGSSTYEFSVDGQVFFRIMEKYAAEYKKQHGGKPAFT